MVPQLGVLCLWLCRDCKHSTKPHTQPAAAQGRCPLPPRRRTPPETLPLTALTSGILALKPSSLPSPSTCIWLTVSPKSRVEEGSSRLGSAGSARPLLLWWKPMPMPALTTWWCRREALACLRGVKPRVHGSAARPLQLATSIVPRSVAHTGAPAG